MRVLVLVFGVSVSFKLVAKLAVGILRLDCYRFLPQGNARFYTMSSLPKDLVAP